MRIKIWLDNEDKNENYICKNCGLELKREEKFCRVCGTRRGEEGMVPVREAIVCMYGPPPIIRKYQCEDCGYQWSDVSMFENEQECCPECGSKNYNRLEEDEIW